MHALQFGPIYAAAILLGHALTLQPSAIATVWPASGLYLTVLLLHVRSERLAILLVGTLTNVLIDHLLFGRSVALAAGFALANGVEALSAVGLMGRLVPGRIPAPGRSLADTLGLVCVALAAPVAGATIGAGSLSALVGAPFAAVWPVWWSADALGILVVAPLALSLAGEQPREAPSGRMAERTGSLLVLTIVAGVVFLQPPAEIWQSYLLLPPMLWIALRLDARSVASGVALVALAATFGSTLGFGPFAREGLSGTEQVMGLQLFVCLFAAAAQLVASASAEREAALRRLAAANRELEAVVGRRTAELSDATAALAAGRVEIVALSEASPIALFRASPDGTVVAANDGFLRLAGSTREDLAEGRVRWRVAPSADPSALEFQRPDGSTVPVLVSRVEADGPSGLATAFVVDLTEWRRSQDALRERAELLEATSDCVVAMDRDWNLTFFNHRAAKHLGLKPEQRGCNLWEIFPQAVGGPFWHIYRRSMEQRTTACVEAFSPVLGRRFRAESHPSGDGGIVVFFRDVTEEREDALRLAESEARLRALFHAIDEGCCFAEMVLDEAGRPADYRFLEVNPLFEAMTGLKDAVGRTALELVPGLERHWIETYGRVALEGETVRLEQGSDAMGRWFDVFAAPAGKRGRFALVFKDVTARREAEAMLARGKAELERLVVERTEALRASETRLAQAAKMEALGRLAGGIAHDFNNVLQAVQSGISLARTRLRTEPGSAERFLDLALESAERGASVTGRLLSFARRGELVPAAIEPAPLLQSLAEILRHTLGSSVELEVACEPGLPPALADAAQLESALVNLANNARDALPEGRGRIVLGAVLRPLPLPTGSEPAPQLPAGRYLRLSVRDDGEGMDEAVLARVTEPFFTTKPLGRGTGLGLPMARGFAEQSRGALTIDSAPGRGTEVALWLPVAGSEQPAAGARGGVGDDARESGGAERAAVLLVDDEAGLREMLGQALTDRGHRVTVAASAAEALDHLEREGPADILVTDLTMPGGTDGLGLIRQARRLRPGLPAILVTGHFGEATRGALQAAAGDAPSAVLRKPLAATSLEAQIEALLQVRRDRRRSAVPAGSPRQ